MKMTRLIGSLFLLVITASCSSDGGGGSSSTDATMSLNGTSVNLTSPLAQRGDNTIVIMADLPNDESIQLEFNKFGDLAEFSYWTDTEVYKNFQHYKSNYFNFTLVSLNESTHRVKVSFSGTIYADETDMSSDSKEVSGTFDLPYITTSPLVTGLGLNCKIAGTDWYETQFWDNGFGNVDRKYISDDNNQIIMQFDDEDMTLGTYSFTNSSSNKMKLAKYNTTTHTYDEYNTSGTVTISSNTEPIFGIRVLEGTFNFTATNPSNSSDVIQVTNGAFKTNF